MNAIKDFEVCGNHQEIGRAIGRQFADSIHSFFDNYDSLQNIFGQWRPGFNSNRLQVFFG